jgi:hypothetical protein
MKDGSKKARLALWVIPLFIFFMAAPGHAEKEGPPRFTEVDLGDKGFHVSVKDGRVSLSARGADIRVLLREMARKAGVDAEIDPNLQGLVSTSFLCLPGSPSPTPWAGTGDGPPFWKSSRTT